MGTGHVREYERRKLAQARKRNPPRKRGPTLGEHAMAQGVQLLAQTKGKGGGRPRVRRLRHRMARLIATGARPRRIAHLWRKLARFA